MRKFIAILAAEFTRFITQITRRGSGSALPGIVAQKVDPNIITKLSKMLPKGIIMVTGTNGKTTTAKMIAGILEESGTKVIYNFSGSNLSRGIASFLIRHTNFWGTKIDGEIGLFEVDEATMPEICNLIKPSVIVVTNLFRDQLDRYGEVDKTAAIIEKAIRMSPDSLILLNADDPLVASLGFENKNARYFGIEADYKALSSGAIDTRNCISCGHELVFKPRYFGHLGNYRCPNCSFARPKPTFSLKKLDLRVEKSVAEFAVDREKTEITINLPGLYNLYNALAAASVAKIYDIPAPVITHALGSITAAFGRMEKVQIGNKFIYLLLVKNPTGFTQSIETLTYDGKPKSFLFALNDNFADGTDISWIWDAELEIIQNLANFAVASGLRTEDMMLRLKYAGFNMRKVKPERDLAAALDLGIANIQDGETLYILPTYTAMLALRKILAQKGLVKGFME